MNFNFVKLIARTEIWILTLNAKNNVTKGDSTKAMGCHH